MNVFEYEGASELLLAEEPAANELAKDFAERTKDRIDLAGYERLVAKKLGREATGRDRMRLMTYFLLAGGWKLVLAHLKEVVKNAALVRWYSKELAGYVVVRPDGKLAAGSVDVDFEANALVRYPGHDPFGGHDTMDRSELADALWECEIQEELLKRRDGARKVVRAGVWSPSWAADAEGCRLARAVRERYAKTQKLDAKGWLALVRWLRAHGDPMAETIDAYIADDNVIDLHRTSLRELHEDTLKPPPRPPSGA